MNDPIIDRLIVSSSLPKPAPGMPEPLKEGESNLVSATKGGQTNIMEYVRDLEGKLNHERKYRVQMIEQEIIWDKGINRIKWFATGVPVGILINWGIEHIVRNWMK